MQHAHQDADAVLPSPVSTSSSRSTVSTSPDSYLATPENHLASLAAYSSPISQHQSTTSQDTLHPTDASLNDFAAAAASASDSNNSLLFYFNDHPALFDDAAHSMDLFNSSPFGKADPSSTTSFQFSPPYSGAMPSEDYRDGAAHTRMSTSDVQALFSAPRLTVSFPNALEAGQQQGQQESQQHEDGKRRRTTLLSSPTANVIKLEQEQSQAQAQVQAQASHTSMSSLDGASPSTSTSAATSPTPIPLPRRAVWSGAPSVQTPSSTHSTPSVQTQQSPTPPGSDLAFAAFAMPSGSSAKSESVAASSRADSSLSSAPTSEASMQVKKRERQETDGDGDGDGASQAQHQQEQQQQQQSDEAGADGSYAKAGHEVIWTDEVEVAFWEALRLIPKLGARKVMMHNKACGRNELIAAYILRKTGMVRTRKQVSSHLQVLKRLRDRDREVFQLLADPVHDWEFYIPAGGAVYTKTLAGYGLGGDEGPYPIIPADKDVPRTEDVASVPDSIKEELKMLRHANPIPRSIPMSPSPQLRRANPSVRASPAMSNNEGLMAPPLSAGGRLALAMDELQIPSPGMQRGGAAAQTISPILPASFAMWAHTPQQDARHVYAVLDTDAMLSCARGTSSLPNLPLDRVRIGVHRFPGLVAMHSRLPCQFLHMHVPLCLPRVTLPNKNLRYNQFSTQLTLTSVDETSLTAVTTVYSHGKRLLTLVEPLAPPRKTNMGGGSASRHASPNLATVPLASPLETPQSAASLSGQGAATSRHRWVHQAPFATDFWADFLSRPHPVHIHAAHPEHAPPPTFTKPARERAAVGMAVSGITVIQEFVVASEDRNRPVAPAGGAQGGADISPGSSVGAVVLVVAWDLEYVQTLGNEPGSPTVSVLVSPTSTQALERSVYAQPRHLQHGGSPNMQANGHSVQAPAPQRVFQGQPAVQQRSPFHGGFAGRPEQSSLLRKRGISMMKPNLIVAIPPVPAYLSGRVDGVEAHAQQQAQAPHTAQPGMRPPLGSAGLVAPQRQAHAPLRSAPPQSTSMGWGEMQQRALDASNGWAHAPQPFADAHTHTHGLGISTDLAAAAQAFAPPPPPPPPMDSLGNTIPYGLVSQVDPTFGTGVSSPEMAQLQAGHALLTGAGWNLGGAGSGAGAGAGGGTSLEPQALNGDFDLQPPSDFADMYANLGFMPFHPQQDDSLRVE